MNLEKTRRVAVFPYDNEMYAYLQYPSMLEHISIEILLSPNGWGLEHKSSLSPNDYDRIDAVWLTDSSHDLPCEQLCEMAENMLIHKKQIILTRKVQKETYEKIAKLVKKYDGVMEDIAKENNFFDIKESPLCLYDIYTPIIGVAGVGENTDKFLAQLAIKKYLEEKGHHVVLVTSRSSSAFLHHTYSFPDFMDRNIPTEYKIVSYNHFIKKIEQEEKPEVILIGIPEGIMPMSKLQVGYFGIHAFEILNAINPDFFVMCLYGNEISDKYVRQLKKIVQYKYMTEVDCFYLSRTAQDVFTVNRSMPIEYYIRNQSDIKALGEKLTADTDKMDKFYTETDVELMAQYIIDSLNEHVEAELL